MKSIIKRSYIAILLIVALGMFVACPAGPISPSVDVPANGLVYDSVTEAKTFTVTANATDKYVITTDKSWVQLASSTAKASATSSVSGTGTGTYSITVDGSKVNGVNDTSATVTIGPDTAAGATGNNVSFQVTIPGTGGLPNYVVNLPLAKTSASTYTAAYLQDGNFNVLETANVAAASVPTVNAVAYLNASTTKASSTLKVYTAGNIPVSNLPTPTYWLTGTKVSLDKPATATLGNIVSFDAKKTGNIYGVMYTDLGFRYFEATASATAPTFITLKDQTGTATADPVLVSVIVSSTGSEDVYVVGFDSYSSPTKMLYWKNPASATPNATGAVANEAGMIYDMDMDSAGKLVVAGVNASNAYGYWTEGGTFTQRMATGANECSIAVMGTTIIFAGKDGSNNPKLFFGDSEIALNTLPNVFVPGSTTTTFTYGTDTAFKGLDINTETNKIYILATCTTTVNSVATIYPVIFEYSVDQAAKRGIAFDYSTTLYGGIDSSKPMYFSIMR